MKIKWQEEDLGENMKRYQAEIITEDGVSSGFCGGFEASVDTEKYKNICVTDFAFENDEAQKTVFEAFFEKMKLPLYFKPNESNERIERQLEEMGAKQIEDLEEVTIWYNAADKRVWKFEG